MQKWSFAWWQSVTFQITWYLKGKHSFVAEGQQTLPWPMWSLQMWPTGALCLLRLCGMLHQKHQNSPSPGAVPPVGCEQLTEHQRHTATLWPWWIKTKWRPLRNHVWMQAKSEHCPYHTNDQTCLCLAAPSFPAAVLLASVCPVFWKDLLKYAIIDYQDFSNGLPWWLRQ